MEFFQAFDLLHQKMRRIAAPAGEVTLRSQQKILLRHEKDLVPARIISGSRELPNVKLDDEFTFERVLGSDEFLKWESAQKDSLEHSQKAQKSAEKYKLNMHFFASRQSFHGKILSFFFTAPQNVDFRELVKDLAREFKCRIHLQRVSPQERAKIVGGVGSCGREECCTFLDITKEKPTMDAVRDQGIMIKYNPKIYGVTGKLKGCLLYERDMYRQNRKYLPHIRQPVTVKQKPGRVMGLDILNLKVKILFEETDTIDVFDVADVEYEKKQVAPESKPITVSEPEIDIHGEALV